MTDFAFRKKAVKTLTPNIGVYVLCDLDEVPIYVGQSKDGIRQRVARHLTSARSDIIANRQIDVWEIAYVWAYAVDEASEIDALESHLFHTYNSTSPLMNGAVPPVRTAAKIPERVTVQVMSAKEIEERKKETQRLPRQAEHYARIVDHFLTVKNATQIARAMDAHFARLQKYHKALLGQAEPQEDDGVAD